MDTTRFARLMTFPFLPLLYRLLWLGSFGALILLQSCHTDEPGPSTASDPEKGFTIDNFAVPPLPLTNQLGARIIGPEVDLSHNSLTDGIRWARIGPGRSYNFSTGFETTFAFTATQGTEIDLRLELPNKAYRPFGLELTPSASTPFIGWKFTKTTISKPIPSLLDGKRHTVKFILKNTVSVGTVCQVFVDDLSSPVAEMIREGQSVSEWLAQLNESPIYTPSIQAFSLPAGPVQAKIYSWDLRIY